MGCASSKVENEEIVSRCRERKRLMKQAVFYRQEFAVSHLQYLQALRNAGLALRQFAEVESSMDDHTNTITFPETDEVEKKRLRKRSVIRPPPPPPPPPALYLPPSPPHKPQDLRPSLGSTRTSNAMTMSPPKNSVSFQQQWNIPRDSDAESLTLTLTPEPSPPPPPPPPPPPQGSPWDFFDWDPFRISYTGRASRASRPSFDKHPPQEPPHHNQHKMVVEEEQWDEAATEFDEEEQENHVDNNKVSAADKYCYLDTDDNTSTFSWYTKDSDLAMVVSRKCKTLGEIVREIDDYFLKAFEGGRDVSRMLEAGAFLEHSLGNNYGYRSAKVFSALSWTWSSRLPLTGRDILPIQNYCDPNSRRSHCSTLEKISSWERRLYDIVRGGELAKIEYGKKCIQLHRLEMKSGQDDQKIKKTRDAVQMLESDILDAKQSANSTLTCILTSRDNELYPQLVELTQGLMKMWRTMYECHQVQCHIVQQMNQLESLPDAESTSDYHRQATIQLEAEVTSWYKSFCNLIRWQRLYMQALSGWTKLSLCPVDHQTEIGTSENCLAMSALLQQLQQALENLPDKAASESINSFVTVVHAMVVQQAEEQKQRKRSESLSRQLEKKLALMYVAERKYGSNNSIAFEMSKGSLHEKDPLVQKRAKIDAFKRKVEDEQLKHLNLVRATRAMTLNNLQTGLPNVFQALTSFSSVCTQAFESLTRTTKSFRFDV